jgi:ribosome biogenesis GTPase
MLKGRIVKALSGFYYVQLNDEIQTDGSKTIQCRARGVFKNKGISPLVGDDVEIEMTDNGEGTVVDVAPRTTELVRPPVANVNLAVLVFSVVEPAWNATLMDKFLVHTESAGLDAVIVLTKADLLEEERYASDVERVQMLHDRYEEIGYPVIQISAKNEIGIDEVRSALRGKISVLAGQSGVGKSSLVNALVPGLNLETNAISNKLGRGKHTTRHCELIALADDTWIADTPGFSQLDFMHVDQDNLNTCFVEFLSYAEQCKFRGCRHQHEPQCKVQDAVASGEIAKERYENYLQFLQEIQETKRRY